MRCRRRGGDQINSGYEEREPGTKWPAEQRVWPTYGAGRRPKPPRQGLQITGENGSAGHTSPKPKKDREKN